MRMANSSRKKFLFWLFFISFACVAGSLLFFAQPLFLYETGVKASLVAEAKKWRGMPPGTITNNIGRTLKKYLDASKHTSRADIRVSETNLGRLSLDILLPWAEVSAKKRKQRAELVCRLGGEMFENAGAKGVVFLVNILRMTRDSTTSEPMGVMTYTSTEKKCAWKESVFR